MMSPMTHNIAAVHESKMRHTSQSAHAALQAFVRWLARPPAARSSGGEKSSVKYGMRGYEVNLGQLYTEKISIKSLHWLKTEPDIMRYNQYELGFRR